MCDVFSSCINSGRQDDPVLWLLKNPFFHINQEKWINQSCSASRQFGCEIHELKPTSCCCKDYCWDTARYSRVN